MLSHLRVDTEPNGVRTLTLDRPERLNAVNPALADALPAALDDAAADGAVRVVVITGAGRAFCAGLDLKEPAMAEPSDPLAWVGRWVLAVRRCEKPVLAAVNGPAVGAGFGLALACDVRLVASTATMAAGYVRRGLSPDAGVSYYLPRHIGTARAADILFTGRDVSAEEAERVGLAIARPAERFAEEVAAYAARLAAASPTSLALTKRLLTESPDAPLEAHLRNELAYIRTCFATPEVQRAMAAFNAP